MRKYRSLARKKAKKRSHAQVAGLVTENADNDIESCLQELEGAIGTSHVPTATQLLSSTSAASSKKQKIEPAAEASLDETDNGQAKLWNPSIPVHPLFQKAQKNRIKSWNTAFLDWASHRGTYTPGLLPLFDIEVARHFQVNEISSYLLDACSKIKMVAFERWLLDSKVEERQRQVLQETATSDASDVVLSRVTVNFDASKRLIEELREAGMETNQARKVVKELCRRTQVSVQKLVAQSRSFSDQTPLKKGDRIDLEKNGSIYTLVYHRKRWKKPFCVKINSSHYEKLRDMFVRVHNQAGVGKAIKLVEAGKATRATHAFHLITMVLLLRYSSLAGGQLLNDLRGGGMQGAVHGEVFQVLQSTFPDQPIMECFASPLNSFLPSFCSAFSDIDFHFGSVGDFLDHPLTSGCCEANPPFTPGLMDIMTDRMEYNLQLANEQSLSLTFVIIIPSAIDDGSEMPAAKRYAAPSFQRLIDSSACRRHIILSAKEHGYVEGSQTG